MADSEFLLTVGGTDVTDDVWEWSRVSLTDSWTERGTLTFTIRQALGSATTISAFDDVVFYNRLTSKRLFSGFVAPAPIVQRWIDPTWIETDVSCVAYDGLLDLIVTIGTVRVGKYKPYNEAQAARDRIEMLLQSGIGDTRVPTVIAEYGPKEAVTNSEDGVYGGEAEYWEFDPGSKLADALQTVLQYTRSGGTYPFRVLKWAPDLGFIMCDQTNPFRGAAPIALNDAGGYGRPAYVSKTTDTTSLVSGVVLVDSGFYFAPNPSPAPNAVSQRLVPDGSGGTMIDLTETNGWTVTSDTVLSFALSDQQTEPAGAYAGDNTYSFPPAYVYSNAWGPFNTNRNPFVTPVRYDVVSPYVPHDLAIGQELTFTWLPGTDVTASIQSITTTFADGFLDTKAVGWPYYLDASPAWTLSSGYSLDASISSAKPRRMRTHTMTLAGTPKSFLGLYQARTGR